MLILDGAMGTELLRRHPRTRPPFEPLAARRPEIIEAIHMDYLRAGADIITTPTLCCRSPLEAEAAARLARRCADRFPGRRVAGALGPGAYDREVARALMRGGADFLLFETITSAACVRQAASSCGHAPAVYCASPSPSGALLSGESLESFVRACAEAGAAAIGLNCGSCAAELMSLIPRLAALTRLPLVAYPSIRPGESLADIIAPYAPSLAVAGGCCGSTPSHIASLAALR